MVTEQQYDASQIKVLEGLEAVRMRPGMYIGSTSSRGLHHLINEIVDNAVDESLAGYCKNIHVTIEEGNVISVKDDGRGMPVDTHPELGLPTPQVILTKLHAGGKFGGESYKVSGGLHGVGAAVVNALSEWLEVTVDRDGKRYQQRFARGQAVSGLEIVGNSQKTGTQVRWKADAEIFQKVFYERKLVEARLRELAYLNPGLAIHLKDERLPSKRGAPEEEETHEVEPELESSQETFLFPGGLSEYVAYLNDEQDVIHEPVYFEGEFANISVETVFQYNTGYSEVVTSYCNCIKTIEGGTHEVGFKNAYTRILNDYAKQKGLWKKKDNLTGHDLREGLMAVIHVRMQNAEFEGQTKTKLGNPEARAAIEELMAGHLTAWLDEHPEEAKRIVEKASTALEARKAAQKARKAVQTGKSSKRRTSLDGKLTRCSGRVAERNELFIVEGDSAGGSAKQGRDRAFQAILPLKGKPLNTTRASITKVLANREILSIVQAVGAGIEPEFTLDESNYGKIIVLADADDDGAHIRCLLLTFFYRFMKPLLLDGRIFIAQPPLYKVEHSVKKKTVSKYFWDDELLQAYLSALKGRKSAVIQRFKGLGEMNPEQLWDTTMNPETRSLIRVTIEDAAAAEKQVHTLMGKKAEPRKLWITKNVHFGEDDEELNFRSAPEA